jgi:hypothetical protein
MDIPMSSSGSHSWCVAKAYSIGAITESLKATDVIGEASFGESFRMLETGKVSGKWEELYLSSDIRFTERSVYSRSRVHW